MANTHTYYSANPIARLLDRLDKVRETGSGRWLACCPAHDDRTPSLSVRETGDGTVLVHCFAQCPPGDVLAAVGLELADLFPNKMPHRGPSRRRMPAIDALIAINHEAHMVAVIASDIRQARTVDDDTWERLATATRRIAAARAVCR